MGLVPRRGATNKLCFPILEPLLLTNFVGGEWSAKLAIATQDSTSYQSMVSGTMKSSIDTPFDKVEFNMHVNKSLQKKHDDILKYENKARGQWRFRGSTKNIYSKCENINYQRNYVEGMLCNMSGLKPTASDDVKMPTSTNVTNVMIDHNMTSSFFHFLLLFIWWFLYSCRIKRISCKNLAHFYQKCYGKIIR